MKGSRALAPTAQRRPETGADAAFLAALFFATHGTTFAGLEPAFAELLLNQQFAAQKAGYRAAHPGGRFDIVEVEGRPVGRIVTDVGGTDIQVVDVALLPDWRGRGIGTRLLRALQDEAVAAGVPLRLSVLGTNARARKLYEALGFRAVAATGPHVELRWVP